MCVCDCASGGRVSQTKTTAFRKIVHNVHAHTHTHTASFSPGRIVAGVAHFEDGWVGLVGGRGCCGRAAAR